MGIDLSADRWIADRALPCPEGGKAWTVELDSLKDPEIFTYLSLGTSGFPGGSHVRSARPLLMLPSRYPGARP
jgi:hypothetical protein